MVFTNHILKLQQVLKICGALQILLPLGASFALLCSFQGCPEKASWIYAAAAVRRESTASQISNQPALAKKEMAAEFRYASKSFKENSLKEEMPRKFPRAERVRMLYTRKAPQANHSMGDAEHGDRSRSFSAPLPPQSTWPLGQEVTTRRSILRLPCQCCLSAGPTSQGPPFQQLQRPSAFRGSCEAALGTETPL